METLKKIESVKNELFSLYEKYIFDQIAPIFTKNPAVKYFHYARHGNSKERYLSINGIRWEDIDYFIHAIEFEASRRDNNTAIASVIQATIEQLPDFKALRLAAEDTYRVLADLTTEGVFNILVRDIHGFRLIATKEFVSYKAIGKEESGYYPANQSQE